MTHGGKRINAGKKKGTLASHTLEAQEQRKKAIAMVDENLIEIFQPQIDKARKGDTQAFNAVLDRAWGRAIQALEVSGKDGKDLFTPSDKLSKLADDLLKIQQGRIS